MQKSSKIHVVVVTNITLEPFFSSYLKEAFFRDALDVNVEIIPYHEYLSEESSKKLSNADQIVAWLNVDGIYPNLINDLTAERFSTSVMAEDIQNKLTQLKTFIRGKSIAPILWIGAEDYCYDPYTNHLGHNGISRGLIDRINITLYETIDENDVYVDLKTLIAKIGMGRAFDSKSKYRWNTPYARELLQEIAGEIHKQYRIRKGVTKKCIVLDCDNVLWGGILSEDGVEGIQLGGSGLGRPYQDFGRYILNLYYHGVIIAICSKNDKAEVLRVFREHGEMILKEEHIACFCVNWDNKADNIKAIAETLHIGLDSMVFVDDSDFEIQAVKMLLPEVTAIQYERDHIYEQLSCFHLNKSVDIDKVWKRNRTYQTHELRRSLQAEASSFDEYLKALAMKVEIHKALPIELSRVAELTQRTNKCTNGRRYTVEQLKARLESGYVLYTVCLSDRFSDLGLVGAMGVDNSTLDLFSLSCRALGRNVEETMIDFIRENDIRTFEYDLTAQNQELYTKLSRFITE